MLNTLAAAAIVLGSAALVATAAPTVIDATTATRDAAQATSAAVDAVRGISSPIAAVQDRGIDPEDPRFGDAVGAGVTRMTDAIGRAVRGADRSTWAVRQDVWSEDEAVDACAVAAQDDAAERARIVSVGHVDRVEQVRDGYEVQGIVLARQDFRDRQPAEWTFTCAIDGGRVVDVAFGDRLPRR